MAQYSYGATRAISNQLSVGIPVSIPGTGVDKASSEAIIPLEKHTEQSCIALAPHCQLNSTTWSRRTYISCSPLPRANSLFCVSTLPYYLLSPSLGFRHQPNAGCRLVLQDLSFRRLQNGIEETPADNGLADYFIYESGSKILGNTRPSTVQLPLQPTTSSVELNLQDRGT